MLEIVLSKKFKQDLKTIQKRGYDLELLNFVVEELAQQKILATKYRDHALSGNFAGFRECHIRPDWLLVYRIHEKELLLFLSRTGSHSDLFS